MHGSQNIKSMDRVDFERRLLNSPIFTGPAVTTEEFLSQIEREVTATLDVVASLHRAVVHDITVSRRTANCRRSLSQQRRGGGF